MIAQEKHNSPLFLLLSFVCVIGTFNVTSEVTLIDIATLISTVGFPIVAFLLMYRLYCEHLNKSDELREKTNTILQNVSSTVSENTATLRELKVMVQNLNGKKRRGDR